MKMKMNGMEMEMESEDIAAMRATHRGVSGQPLHDSQMRYDPATGKPNASCPGCPMDGEMKAMMKKGMMR